MGRKTSSVQNFLYSFDRYAKPVSLAYKKQGNFTTSIGGCCSIITFTWLFYWVIINLIDVLTPPGKYKTTVNVDLIQVDGGSYP